MGKKVSKKQTQLALLAAKTLISRKNDWIRDNLAMTKNSEVVKPEKLNACKWCAVGAIKAAVPNKLQASATRALRHAAVDVLELNTSHPTNSLIFEVNDYEDHKAVMRMYDVAIASLDGA